MANSWRISVLLNDQSAVTLPVVGSVGATVLSASKGPETPIFFAPGQGNRIRTIYGQPSAAHPGIWDAIEYNNQFPLRISAPSSNSYHGGAIVRPTGTEAFDGGLPSDQVSSFDALPQAKNMGVGDGAETAFTATVGNTTDANEDSFEIVIDDTPENIASTDNGDGTWSLSGDNGTGTYESSTGSVIYTFSSAPASGALVDMSYTVDVSDAYFILFDKRAAADDLAVMVTNTDGVFSVNAFRKDGLSYSILNNYPKQVSIIEGAKDGFGSIIYAEDVFAEDDLIGAVANDAVTFTTFTDDSANVDFGGGVRGVTEGTDLVRGWQQFQQKNTYPTDIFFDTSADPSIPSQFDTLRKSFQKYSAYILPLPNESDTDAQSTKDTYSISNRGIYFYWNWGQVRDGISGRKFWSTLMGRVATKHAQMFNVYNGLAPSWIDENNHGGQLGGGILKMAYDPSETAKKSLDEGQINPIVFDPQYGVMITSQRTSLTSLSDYSWIGHSRVADFIIKNIVEQVLPYQLTKLNDTDHRTRVKSKADSIIDPLSKAPYNLLRDYVNICDETNNTDDVLSRREFILETQIKFTPFSEYVKFVFTNVDQSVEIQEA